MKGRDPVIEELLSPLSEKYGSSAQDRDRVASKLREKLGAAAFASATVATPVPRVRRFATRRWPWIGGSSIIVAGILFGARPSSAPSAHVRSAPSPIAPAVTSLAPAATNASATEPAAAQLPTIAVDALPSATLEKTQTAPSARRVASDSADAEDALARETRLWAAANEARSAGDTEKALRILDEHAREFPTGVLADQRVVERIVVLCQRGQRSAAVRAAEAFSSAHPNSPLRTRIASTCVNDIPQGDIPRVTTAPSEETK